MHALFFACLAVLVSGIEAGPYDYTPPYARVDLAVRYLTQGLANYVSVRCSWNGLPHVTAYKMQVVGPAKWNRSESMVIGLFDATHSNITNLDNTAGMSLEGSLNCDEAGSGCKEGEVIYAELVWRNFPATWDSPVYEPFGCNLWTEYQNKNYITLRYVNLRVREDNKNEIVDPSIDQAEMHFRLRGGLDRDGSVSYLYMRCSATREAGTEVKGIQISKPAGAILAGVYDQGNNTNSEGDRVRVNFQLDCDADNTGCYANEKAYLGVIWRNMDASRDIGAEADRSFFYTPKCSISAVKAGQGVFYEQTRTVRIGGGIATGGQRVYGDKK